MGSGVSFHGGKMERWNCLTIPYKIYDNANKLIKSAEPTSNTVVDQRGAGFDMDIAHFTNFTNAITKGEKANFSVSGNSKKCHALPSGQHFIPNRKIS